jgi:ComF family protein
LACRKNAPPYGEDICTPCKVTLPETNFHLEKENEFTNRFWGRVELESGAALYHFTKSSRVQELLHNLKYKGKKQVGISLGRRYGYALSHSPLFMEAEIIVPVPLHPKKQYLRGYNQSEMFAQGLSESMSIPYLKNGLIRLVHSQSQTKKSRLGRLENLEGVFALGKAKMLAGRHILLVDDVLTTGSTLEACALELLKIPGAKVSMATIAMATL